MAVSAGFRVVTDSTADLPSEWAQRYGIEVVPLTVNFGNESFRDRVDLTDEQFYAKLAAASKLPTTSAPSPGDFAAVYERLKGTCEGCISIHLGSNISATVESARLGAESVPGFRVEVIDTLSVTMPVAFLCRVAAESPSLEEAVKRVAERVPKLRVLALLDTLRYIEMGGRVNRAQAMIGSMLDLKPILTLKDGEIKGADRVRTRRRAVERLIELFKADLPVESVAVMHAQAPEESVRIRDELQESLPGVEIQTEHIGCVLGTHTGPGAVGLGYVRA